MFENEQMPQYNTRYHDKYSNNNEPIFKSTYAQGLLKDRNAASQRTFLEIS